MIVMLATWPWILGGLDQFPQKSYDHDRFHLPLVREFAAQFPACDLADYPSATGPGFHVVLAAIAQVVGTGETTLQLVGSLMAIGLGGTVAWRLASWRGSAWQGVLLSLPLVLNPYLLGNAIWLMTDNLSLWLLASAILGATLLAATPARLGRWGSVAAAACVVRQINLWVLGPIVVAGAIEWWRGRRGSMLAAGAMDRMDRGNASPRVLGWTILACLPAILVVGGFAWLWGGLTPPSFQEYHAVSLQPAAVPYGLTLLAAYGAPLWLPILVGRGDRGRVPAWFAATASFGWVAFLIAGNSDAGLEHGRNGGWLWTIVERLPTPGGVSIVLAAGSAAGVILLVQLVALAAGRGRLPGAVVAAATLAAFLVAHAANKQLFQRYFDPTVLLVLAILAALAWCRRGDPRSPRDAGTLKAWIVALLVMAAMQVNFAVATLFAPLARAGSAEPPTMLGTKTPAGSGIDGAE